MDAFFDSLGLTLLYLALLIVGLVYSAIVLFGGLGGADAGADVGDVDLGGTDAGVDLAADTGGLKVPALSPVAIASFVTAFGGFGLIGIGLFEATGPVSLAWALGGGLLVAVAAHFSFVYFLIRPQGSSEVRLTEIVGAVAEVTTPISAVGLGEIAFVAQGGRLTYTARSATGKPIARGATVVIERVVGGVAIVRPQR